MTGSSVPHSKPSPHSNPQSTPEAESPSTLHSTFSLERAYALRPERVFAAWADPVAKARWFAGPDAEHDLDFRPGGRERVLRPGGGGDPTLRFESVYHDIVPARRIVYVSALYADDRLSTVSLTTVRFDSSGGGTHLLLTEQGTYLDGQEPPSWREQGTSTWLDALSAELETT
jgi:uncharacterized protein YndB with AHSA1/START domain